MVNEKRVKEWEEKNNANLDRDALKELGFTEKKPILDTFKIFLIVVVIAFLILVCWTVYNKPEIIKNVIGTDCVNNVTQIANCSNSCEGSASTCNPTLICGNMSCPSIPDCICNNS